MSIKQIAVAVLSLGVGLGVGNGVNLGIAQQEDAGGASEEAQWEIYHAPMSDRSDNAFYVVKHNRLTGETLVLSAIGGADDDAWYRLPVEEPTSGGGR